MRGNCTPVGIECAVYLLIATATDPRSNHNNQIQSGKLLLVQPETLPDKPFDPVTFYRIAGGLDRNCHTEPRIFQLVSDR